MFTFILCLATLVSTSVVSSKQKVCPPYPHVILDHGSIYRVGYQKYSFKCDKGYFLASRNTVRCYRGNWTDLREPKCLKIQGQCVDPPTVKHAQVFGDEKHVGARVKYICDEGFILLGHSELTCSRSGHWNKRPPSCMDENEPLQHVAERLQDSFVTHLQEFSNDTATGRHLGKSELHFGLELYLLIDRSSSVDPVHLEQAKEFINFLLSKFAVRNGVHNKNGTRASLITFGTNVQTVFSVDDPSITNAETAAVAVNAIEPNGGGTNIEGALTKVALDVHKLRERAKRALFLMTDGEPNVANPIITPQDIAAQLKHTYGFEIFTIGIGRGINVHLLNELASEPPLNHVFILDDYPVLKELMEEIEDSKPQPPPIGKDHCGYNGTHEGRPWLATLYIGGDPFKICEGVLICSQWVLTAASCLQEGEQRVSKKDVFVVLGERNLIRPEKGQTNFYVVDMRIHMNYDPQYVIRNNLAVLKLDQPTKAYRPACLPPTDDRPIPLHLNLKISASIAGWGLTSASRTTYGKAGDLSFEMFETPVSLSIDEECPLKERGESLLCAGQGTKTCYGLVGSPLMAEDSSTGFQHILGVLADRRRCAKGQNQYVELTKYVNWINHVTSNCQLKHWGLSNKN